ncbi:MAG: hypothetical protein SNH79_07045 [Rikenellaceae bacterium]
MKYFQRAIKYLMSLCVIYLLAIHLMWRLGLSFLSPQESVMMLLHTQRGVMMIVAVVVLSAAYPLFGFMRKRTYGDIVANRETIIEVMALNNFALQSEIEGREMRFVANNIMKRVGMLFEDQIVVTAADENRIELSGNRKAIAYILFRLEVAIDRAAESIV